MNNDPKDTVVDMTKLMRSQLQSSVKAPIPIIPKDSISKMLTTCNESAESAGNNNDKNHTSRND